jgi:polysaccharide export outer membrane protein
MVLEAGESRVDAANGLVVSQDGTLYLPFLGRVQVAGLTVPQARDLIASRLEPILQHPELDLKVLAYRSQKIFVTGEVRNPGTYTVTDVPFSLAEAINRAGGFLPTADQSRVVVSRGHRTWTLDFLDLMARGNKIDQVLLMEGDSVNIRHRDEAPVYLLGEVVHTGPVDLFNGRLSLAQALTSAGGLAGTTADARSLYVFRRGSAENAVDVFHVDARNPVSMVLADRFSLRPYDVVYVDAGPLVRLNRVLTLLVPTVSALTATGSDIKYLGK